MTTPPSGAVPIPPSTSTPVGDVVTQHEKTARRQLREMKQARRNRGRRMRGYGQHAIYVGGRCEGCGWHYLDIALYAERILFCPPTERGAP